MKNKTKAGCEIKVCQHGEFGTKDIGYILRTKIGQVDVVVFEEEVDGKIIKNIRHRDFMKEGKPYWQHLDDKR